MSHFNVSLIVWAKSQDNAHKPQILKRRKAQADRTEVLLLTSLPTPAHTLRQVSFSKPDVAVYLSYERRPQNLLVACGNKLKAWSGSAAFYLTEGTTLMMIMSHLHATADKGSILSFVYLDGNRKSNTRSLDYVAFTGYVDVPVRLSGEGRIYIEHVHANYGHTLSLIHI